MTKIFFSALVLAYSGWVGSAFAAPITGTDIVQVDGTEWAQVDIFTGLSWSDLNAVCPGGTCLDGGELNGYDMTEWHWAVTDDVNALFNYYIGSAQMGPGPDAYQEFPGTFATSFFVDGWRATQHFFPGSSRETYGLMSDTGTAAAYMGEWIAVSNIAVTNYEFHSLDDSAFGGWFYRGVSPQIPAPATLALFGLALAGLGWARRKKE